LNIQPEFISITHRE